MDNIPQLLILDITHKCNLSCNICEIWKTADTQSDIERTQINKIIFDAVNIGIPEIALSGGEPLLRPDIFELLDDVRRSGVRNLGILTNGLIIKELLPRLEPYLQDKTITLVVSLDSLNPKLHNKIRNHDSAWQKTVDGLKALASLKKDCPEISFNVISIVLDQNLEELLELADFVKSLGADTLQFQALLANNLNLAQRSESAFWIPQDRLSVLDNTVDGIVAFSNNNRGFIKNSPANLCLMKKYYRGSLKVADVQCLSAAKTVLVDNLGRCVTCFSCYGNLKQECLGDILGGTKIKSAKIAVSKCSWPCLLPCFCDAQGRH